MTSRDRFLDTALPRTRTHAFIPGAGTAIQAASTQIDFLMYIIDHDHFTDGFDWVTGISAGSMVAAALATPKYPGAKTPMFQNCAPIRVKIREDSREIFDPWQYKTFFFRRALLSLVALLSDTFDSKKESITHSIEDLPLSTEGQNFWKWLMDQPSDLKNWLVRALTDLPVTHAHFNTTPLELSLKAAFKLGSCENPFEWLRDARMDDLLVPLFIPVLRTDQHGTPRVYHTKLPNGVTLDHIPEIFRDRFISNSSVYEAVLASSSLSPLFKPEYNPDDGYYYTDGGANIHAEDMVKNAQLVDQIPGPYGVITFSSALYETPCGVSPYELRKIALTTNAHANMRQQFDANRLQQDMRLRLDPNCQFAVTFQRPSIYRPFFPVSGPLERQLREFSHTVVGRDFHAAVRRKPLEIKPLTIASCDPNYHDWFMDVGLQTCAQMLPEFVQTAKRLVLAHVERGTLTQENAYDILANIDNRFPPTALTAYTAKRNEGKISGIPDYHHQAHFAPEPHLRVVLKDALDLAA
jgi:hypothetical protein